MILARLGRVKKVTGWGAAPSRVTPRRPLPLYLGTCVSLPLTVNTCGVGCQTFVGASPIPYPGGDTPRITTAALAPVKVALAVSKPGRPREGREFPGSSYWRAGGWTGNGMGEVTA
jgi:hypothetical protein